MSRVFSRRPGVAFRYLRCVSDSSGAADRGLGMREMSQHRSREVRPPRKKALDPPQPWLLSITVEPNATARTAKTTKTARKWALVPLPANAQLRLPVSAFLALFLQTWPVKCLLPPPLLWPCLLLPMPKGMAAGHQQALAAQAEQRRMRGR